MWCRAMSSPGVLGPRPAQMGLPLVVWGESSLGELGMGPAPQTSRLLLVEAARCEARFSSTSS